MRQGDTSPAQKKTNVNPLGLVTGTTKTGTHHRPNGELLEESPNWPSNRTTHAIVLRARSRTDQTISNQSLWTVGIVPDRAILWNCSRSGIVLYRAFCGLLMELSQIGHCLMSRILWPRCRPDMGSHTQTISKPRTRPEGTSPEFPYERPDARYAPGQTVSACRRRDPSSSLHRA